MSRPSKYTEKLGDAICERIVSGESLRTICTSATMPNRSTVMRWMADDAAFATKYARARVIQADFLEEEMSEIEDETLRGSLDPAAARVVLASKQWRAAKLAPKRYGEKLAIGGADDLPALQSQAIVTLDPSEAYKRLMGAK